MDDEFKRKLAAVLCSDVEGCTYSLYERGAKYKYLRCLEAVGFVNIQIQDFIPGSLSRIAGKKSE